MSSRQSNTFARAPSYTSQRGGQIAQHGGGDDDEFYRYKARKYHYKIQHKLKEIMQSGGSCPAGYADYLKPFNG
jgi:hypothetical protein